MPISVYGETNPDHTRFLVPRDALLWRYMDIGKYLDLITKRKIWFPRLSELRKTDPYEGELTENDEDRTRNIVAAKDKEELKPILIRYGETGIASILDKVPEKSLHFFQLLYLSRLPLINFNAYTHSISCWHHNQTESDAMWGLYAQKAAGVAVTSTVSRILKAFESNERNMSIAKVTYDSTGSLSALTSGIFDSLLIKRHAFEHENEVRVIASTMDGYELPEWTKENQRYRLDVSKPVAPGVYIECDIYSLIDEVVISPLMPAYSAEALENITSQVLPKMPIRRSGLLTKQDNPLKVSRELMTMLEQYHKTGLIRDIDQISGQPQSAVASD
jgi:hypothetical protein